MLVGALMVNEYMKDEKDQEVTRRCRMNKKRPRSISIIW